MRGRAGSAIAVVHQLHDAVNAGELSRALPIYDEFEPLPKLIVAGDLPTAVKVGLELLGVGVGIHVGHWCRSTTTVAPR